MSHKFAEILANLLLGLVAILVPIFAVLTSVLARAIQEGRRKLEQTIKGLFDDVEEVKRRSAGSPQATVTELQKAIRRYSWRRRKARMQEFLLSTRAAVYYPGLLFLISLFLLVPPLADTAASSRPDFWFIGTSCALASTGAAILCGVLQTVSVFAATYETPIAPDAPSLEVKFPNNASVVVWTAGSTQQCILKLRNTSDYLAETILAGIFFPPQFTVTKTGAQPRLVPQPPGTDYPGYTAAFWDVPRLHARANDSLAPVEVKVPTGKGEHVLPLRIGAAKIPIIDRKLKVIVS